MTRPINIALRPAERRICAPPSAADPAEWAEKFRVVFAGERGGRPWRNEYAPWLVFPMQVCAWPSVRRITLAFTPQTGKTQVAMNFLGWAADCHPAQAIWAMPDEDACKRTFDKRLEPLFRRTDRMRGLLTGRARDMSHSGVKLANGFEVKLASAKSVSAIASESARYIIMDEIDKYGDFAGREASPVSLLEERSRSYVNTRLIMKLCTVTTKDNYIWVALAEESDVVFDLYARCPHALCGSLQLMKFEQINLRGVDDPREMERSRAARYVCEDCGAEWDDRLRNQAVAMGEWRPRLEVEAPVSVGFHLPAWISRFVSLSECAAAYLRGKTSLIKKQYFVTQICCIPWEDVVRDPEEERLRELIDPDQPAGIVPEGAVALTLAADMQKTSFVYSVLAHAVRPVRRSWLIDYGQVGTWDELATILDTTWPLAGGGDMGVWRGGLDTGGGEAEGDDEKRWTRTEEAYLWLQDPKRRGRVYGLKGGRRARDKPIRRSEVDVLPKSRRKLAHVVDLRVVDAGYFKDIVDERLNDPETGRPIHFHADTDADFLRQLTAEKKVRDEKQRVEWVKRGSRPNHYWDTLVYHEALCSVLFKPCLDRLPGPVRVSGKEQPRGPGRPIPSAGGVLDIRAGLTGGRQSWNSGR